MQHLWTVAAFLVGAPILSGAAAPAATAQAVDISPFIAQEITPKVHLLTTPDDLVGFAIGNILLIEQRHGFVVIDSGIDAANGRAVVAYARSLSPKPIKAVAITHWHNDHPQGISAIRDAYPNVRIISTRPTEDGMLGPEAFDVGYEPNSRAEAAVAERVGDETAPYRKLLDDPATPADRKERIRKALGQFDQYLRDFHGTYIVPPTETFEHELLIDDPAIPVRLMFLGRANTAGDLVTWLPRQKIVESGDIVVSPYPFGFGSYPADWIQTIGKLKSMGFKTLIPGHGHPQSDTSYLNKLITTISEIRSQVGPLAKQGFSLEDVQKKVDFSKVGELFGSTPNDRANFKSLFSDPMTEMAYKEARGEPIIQGIVPADFPKPRFTEPAPKSSAVHHKS
jgi:glyoxylase-like metal-dependent hydrolase (beta-lactamase superfamily II)